MPAHVLTAAALPLATFYMEQYSKGRRKSQGRQGKLRCAQGTTAALRAGLPESCVHGVGPLVDTGRNTVSFPGQGQAGIGFSWSAVQAATGCVRGEDHTCTCLHWPFGHLLHVPPAIPPPHLQLDPRTWCTGTPPTHTRHPDTIYKSNTLF